MDLKALVARAAALLETDVLEFEDTEGWSLTIDIDGVRSQGVWLFTAEHDREYDSSTGQVIHCESRVGQLSDSIDGIALLRMASQLIGGRLVIKGDGPGDIQVCGALPCTISTPETLAVMIAEVATFADELENRFFDLDDD